MNDDYKTPSDKLMMETSASGYLTKKQSERFVELMMEVLKEQLLYAEFAMITWESQLPDPPSTITVLTVSGGYLTEDSMRRVQEYTERCILGGSKQGVLMIEGVPDVEIKEAERLRFRMSDEDCMTRLYDDLIDEYLGDDCLTG